MLKTYTGVTIIPGDMDTDWNIRNSYGNNFVNCAFVGTFVEVNFTRAVFDSACDLSSAVFQRCNFTDINEGVSDAKDPQTDASSVDRCNFSPSLAPLLGHSDPGGGTEHTLAYHQAQGVLYRVPTDGVLTGTP